MNVSAPPRPTETIPQSNVRFVIILGSPFLLDRQAGVLPALPGPHSTLTAVEQCAELL